MKIPLGEGSPWLLELSYPPAGIEDLKKLPPILIPCTGYKIGREVTFANEPKPHKISVVYDGVHWSWHADKPFNNYILTGFMGGIPKYRPIEFSEVTASSYENLCKEIQQKIEITGRKCNPVSEELVLPPAELINKEHVEKIITSWISGLKEQPKTEVR